MIGKILAGRYEIIGKVGGGGMAVVYKAMDHVSGAYVAVKIMRPELSGDAEFIHRFNREAQALEALDHPSIVNIQNIGVEGDVRFIVMEYVAGETLKEYIARKGRLSCEMAVYIATRVSYALEHAHKHGVIHRDIKAQNILLSKDGSVKVGDFGLAKAVTSATVTFVGSNVLGSVHYFSPEQARGAATNEQSDIYSLGVVLYEMLVGRVPFEGGTPVSVALKHVQEHPIPPREIHPDIPQSLERITLKAMSKTQSLRYFTAAALIADLKRALTEPDGKYVTYTPEPLPRGGDTRMVQSVESLRETQDSPNVVVRNHTKADMAAAKAEKEKARRNTRLEGFYQSLRLGVAIVVILGLAVTVILLGTSWFQQQKDKVAVPGVVNYSETQAKSILEQAGFQVVVERQSNGIIKKGYVISQEPKAILQAEEGSAVTIVVSTGKAPVKVPDLMGLSRQVAQELLTGSGLELGSVAYIGSDLPYDYVVKQYPEAEDEVQQGEKVNIWLSNADG